MDSLEEIWKRILDIIARDITPTAYNTWFADCTAVDIADCKLVLHTNSEFKRDIIYNRFGDTIRSALYDIFSCDFELEVLAGEELLEYVREPKKSSTPYPEMDGYTFDNFIVGPSNEFAHAVAIAVAFQWVFNYLVSSTFPSLYDFSPMFAYGLYGVACLLAALFVWRWVPETKGRSLEEMTALWRQKK